MRFLILEESQSCRWMRQRKAERDQTQQLRHPNRHYRDTSQNTCICSRKILLAYVYLSYQLYLKYAVPTYMREDRLLWTGR